MRLRIHYTPLLLEDVLAEGKTEQEYRMANAMGRQSIMNSIRAERTLLLSESDWTQFNDSPLTAEKKSEWATYRQKLRDVTNLVDFSKSFIIDDTFFPTKPD
jgi:Phage tail assembly chaperone protein